jgi:hypothetical protein
MFSKMRQRRAVAGGHPRQRARIVRRAQHHHAVLDVAVAAIDHGKALDLALAAGFGDELRHLAAMRSASACTLVSCASACFGACRDSTSA